MPGGDLLLQIALGLSVLGAVLGVLRWAWNSRKREGGSAERAEALERTVVDASEREEVARDEEAKSHEEWKAAGARRGERGP